MKAYDHTAAWADPAIGQEGEQLEAATAWATARPWSWFVTLTHRDEPSEQIAQSRLRAWLRVLAADLFKEHIPYLVGGSFGQSSRSHLHLVIELSRGATQLERDTALGLWGRNGNARIDVFDPTQGGVRYVLSHPWWDRNVACTRANRCKRSLGCCEAPGPWR